MLMTRITTVTEHQKLFKVYLQIYTLLDRPKNSTYVLDARVDRLRLSALEQRQSASE